MDTAIILEYAWVLIVLIGLEGLLAADNAVVLAVMVRHLDPVRRKKALFYGLLGAFVFRVIAIFLLVWLVQWWWVQALGALYLFYVSITHLIAIRKNKNETAEDLAAEKKDKKQSGFWMTVFKVELADIAFAVDSILAAAAIALTLPAVGGDFFGINVGQYTVMLIGGLIGVVIMRYFANYFVELLAKRPSLEIAAFVIVGWVGVKLSVLTLAHESVALIPHEFPESTLWKVIFWSVMLIIVLIGWFGSGKPSDTKSETL